MYLNSHLSHDLEKVDTFLDRGPVESRARLSRVRAVLRQHCARSGNADALDPDNPHSLGAAVSVDSKHSADALAAIMQQPGAGGEPEAVACLVHTEGHDFEMVAVERADELDAAARRRCVAVKRKKCVALRREEPSARTERVVVTVPAAACGAKDKRDATLEISRLGPAGDSRVNLRLCVTPARGAPRCFQLSNIDGFLADQLFRAPPECGSPAANASPQCGDCSGDCSDYLKAALAEFLERRARLHVILTAAVPPPASRPVCIERASVRLIEQSSSASNLAVFVRLHASSGDCLCAAHALIFNSPGRASVKLETCGRALERIGENWKCPCHKTAVDSDGNSAHNVDGMCTENTRLRVSCWHEKRIGLDVECRLSGAERRELSIIMIAMLKDHKRRAKPADPKDGPRDAAGPEAATRKLERRLDRRLQRVHHLQLERDGLQPSARELLERDVVAVALLREGCVEMKEDRFGKTRLQRTGSDRLSARELEVADTHGHLFKRARKARRC